MAEPTKPPRKIGLFLILLEKIGIILAVIPKNPPILQESSGGDGKISQITLNWKNNSHRTEPFCETQINA